MGMLVKPDVVHRPDRRGCASKIRYRSRKAAFDALRRMHAVGSHRANPVELRGLNVYFCPAHDCWHVGHKPGSSSR